MFAHRCYIILLLLVSIATLYAQEHSASQLWFEETRATSLTDRVEGDLRIAERVVLPEPPYILSIRSKIGGFEPYFVARYEFRNLFYMETKDRIEKHRGRLRIGTRVTLTDVRIVPDTWYAIADVEYLGNFDGAPQEYYNSRYWIHAGVGHRFGYT